MPIQDTVKPLSAALRACATAMEACGVGGDPATGHAKILGRLADHMDAEAASGRVPRAYGEGILQAHGTVVNKELAASIQKFAAEDANLARHLRDMDLTPGGGPRNGQYSIAEIDKKISAAAETNPGIYGGGGSIAVKLRLVEAGVIAR